MILAYYRIGRTRVFVGHCCRFLFRNALVLLAFFLAVASICLFQCRSFGKVTPRYFAVLASSSVWLCILYGYLTGLHLEVM